MFNLLAMVPLRHLYTSQPCALRIHLGALTRIAEWITLFLPSDTVCIKRDFNLQIVFAITVLVANCTKTRK